MCISVVSVETSFVIGHLLLSSLPKMLLLLVAELLINGINAYTANQVFKGDITTLYTPNVYGYKYAGLEMLERDSLIFRVRACSDIHVALAQMRTDLSFNITEVVIGGWSNTKSVYRNGVDGDQRHYLDVDTPNIAHCTEFRTFWISWGSDMLRTGTGPIPGEQMFMELKRTNNIAHHIRFVGFSTGFGVTGVWELEENQGYTLVVRTPDDFRYEYVWKTTDNKNNQFRFAVSACHDVHVNLSPEKGTVYYEVVLGGWNNTKSVIRMGGAHLHEYQEVGIVGCQQWRRFWISWTESTIRVGKEETFTNTFLEWRDESFVGINHLSFSAGYGSDGIWAFNDDLENTYKYYTQSEMISTGQSFNVFLSTVDKEHIFFEVKACSDVWISLSKYPGDVEETAQQVYIGTQNNSKSGVRTGFSSNPIAEVQTTGILNCNHEVTFWMAWGGGGGGGVNRRRFGRGTIVDINVVLSWEGNSSSLITAVGFANAHQQGAYYVIRKNTGDGLLVLTPASHTYRAMWQSVRQDVMTTFRVRACRDVYVSLSGLLGVTDKETYELIIGTCYLTVMWDTSGEYNPIAEASTPDVLSCTSSRSFWISWTGGFIQVGSGSLYGRNHILKLPDSKPHPINAISIATSTVEGDWEFESDTGDQLIILTPNNHGNMKWLHLHSTVHWFHFQVQGSGAILVLCAKYRDSSNCYQILIGSNMNTEYAIWRGNVVVGSFTEPNILSGSEFQDFWLSWKDGLIQLGRTKYRTNVALVAYQDPQPIAVKAVGVHGQGGSNAEWKIASNIASELSFWTERYQSYETWLSVRHRTSLVFGLQSCAHAEILLSAIPMMWLEDDFVYTVVMHGPDNMTTIWQGNRYKKLAEHHTPDLLSCNEERHFWLSWHSGHIALGHGRGKGKNTIVSFQDLNPSAVYALSFSAFEGAGGWRIPLQSDSFVPLTSEEAAPDSLSGGEIAGIVIGSIAMVGVFLFLAFLVVVGPENVFSKCKTSASSKERETVAVSFDNPLSVTEFSDISIA